MFRNISIKLIFPTALAVLSVLTLRCEGCDDKLPFEGFGSYLGSVGHLSRSTPEVITKVLDRIYSDLSLRYFRTAYEPQFSLSPDHYEIPNSNVIDSTFYKLHKELSYYPDISIVASIWSPPFYMKENNTHTLRPEYEDSFLRFINAITSEFKSTFNLTVERVSPVNEPENVFAPWDHTNMIPEQLCQMVSNFSSVVKNFVSVCPENSYFWVSELYSAAPGKTTCNQACEIFGTHAYALNTDILSPNRLKAYYDLNKYGRHTQKPIWMMEVSSTYDYDHYYNHQMQEALDLSINIANFVGVTCIQRYYYWSSFTQGPSGESLIWGNDDGTLYFPKKYYAYKHYTLAASLGNQPSKVEQCDPPGLKDVRCTLFDNRTVVFSNNQAAQVNLVWKGQPQCKDQNICCTTNDKDWSCSQDFPSLPGKSICSCEFETYSTNSSSSSSYHPTVLILLHIIVLASIISNSLRSFIV